MTSMYGCCWLTDRLANILLLRHCFAGFAAENLTANITIPPSQILCLSCPCLVGSSLTNASATHSTGIYLGLTTKLGLDPLMPTSGSVWSECTFWPVPSLIAWELRYRNGQRISGSRPSTGRSRSVTSWTTNIDWKCLDTADTPATDCCTKATGTEIIHMLEVFTTTAWDSPRTTRIMICGLAPTVPCWNKAAGGTTTATGHVSHATSPISTGRPCTWSSTTEWWSNHNDIELSKSTSA